VALIPERLHLDAWSRTSRHQRWHQDWHKRSFLFREMIPSPSRLALLKSRTQARWQCGTGEEDCLEGLEAVCEARRPETGLAGSRRAPFRGVDAEGDPIATPQAVESILQK